MGKEHQHRDAQQVEDDRQDPAPVAKPVDPDAAEQADAWGGSPETASARESVRRDAQTEKLAATIAVPAPSGEASTEQADALKKEVVARAWEVVVAGGAAANGD